MPGAPLGSKDTGVSMFPFKNHKALHYVLSLPYVPRIMGPQSGITNSRVINKYYMREMIFNWALKDK